MYGSISLCLNTYLTEITDLLLKNNMRSEDKSFENKIKSLFGDKWHFQDFLWTTSKHKVVVLDIARQSVQKLLRTA